MRQFTDFFPCLFSISIAFLPIVMAFQKSAEEAFLPSLLGALGNDIGRPLLAAATSGILGPQQAQQQQLMQQQLMQQQLMQQQLAQQQMKALSPQPPPRLDTEQGQKVDTQQVVLNKQLELAGERAQRIQEDAKFLKASGINGKHHSLPAPTKEETGSAVLQALTELQPNQQPAGLKPATEAPIIYVETLPLLPGEQLDADHASECLLEKLGDEDSPAMKAAREYELKKLGETSAVGLAEIQQEVKKTKSAIKAKQNEREKIYHQLKARGRQLAKRKSNKLRASILFANKDLERKDKEISILIEKLKMLKTREAAAINMKKTENGKGDDAEKMSEEDEEE